jgi:hypothetical protein
VIQVSDVGVEDSFWFSRVIVWVVGLCMFWAELSWLRLEKLAGGFVKCLLV